MPDVSVALSGGGHRAALFGLGALLYLADAGVNRDVVSIASVSGGSMTNGYVAQQLDFRQGSVTEFETVAAPLAWRLSRGGTLFAVAATKIYVAILIGSLLAAMAVCWLPIACPARLVLFIAALLVWASVVAGARGRVCARAFREVLYSRNGRPTRLTLDPPGSRGRPSLLGYGARGQYRGLAPEVPIGAAHRRGRRVILTPRSAQTDSGSSGGQQAPPEDRGLDSAARTGDEGGDDIGGVAVERSAAATA